MPPTSLGHMLRPLALVLVRTFFITWLAMAAGGIALAVAAGYWMPNVDPVVRTLLQVFFAFQFVVVGVFVAGRCALSRALINGVQSMRLGRMGLSLLMNRFSAGVDANDDDSDVIDSLSSLPPATSDLPATAAQSLPAAIAVERLQTILSVFALGRSSQGRGAFAWLKSALLSGVGSIALSRFRGKAQRAERIDPASVERELEDQIDGLLLARLRFTLFAWTAMVIGLLVVEVVAISFLANRLAG